MCINPKLILNRKYIPNNKNGGYPPVLLDIRKKYVPIGCGKCYECRKMKANNWKVRLYEEIKESEIEWSFITLTFSNKHLNRIRDILLNKYVDFETGEILDTNGKTLEECTDDNAVSTYAVRHFLENWRKETGKSVKHWLITEKGHKGTKRIHLHGLIKSRDSELIRRKWFYGWVFIGTYVNSKSINYISKYVTKVDTVNKNFQGKIFTSAGIGKNYINSFNFKLNAYNGKETKDYYKNEAGYMFTLPIYYRNYRYSEDEREMLWSFKLDKMERWIFGERIDISQGLENYYKLLDYYRIKNAEMGYFTDPEWSRGNYNYSVISVNKQFWSDVELIE